MVKGQGKEKLQEKNMRSTIFVVLYHDNPTRNNMLHLHCSTILDTLPLEVNQID